MTATIPEIPDTDGVTEVRGQYHRTAHGQGCDGWILDDLETVRAAGRTIPQARYKPCPDPSHRPVKAQATQPRRMRRDMTGELIDE